jgi:hypothetical protein
MHNLITRASYETRLAEHQDGIMNEALDRTPDHRSESTLRRIAAASDNLLKYLLFSEEYSLTDPVEGTSAFATEFAQRGPRDSQGRSLRDFDLQRRLFRYPCSYLIYSKAFAELPAAVKERVYAGLWQVLQGEDRGSEFAHLSDADRRAIREILSDTLPEFVAFRPAEAE